MSEPESSSKDVIIGISIGVVILAGLYVYFAPGSSSPDLTKRPAVAQDNTTTTAPSTKAPKAGEAEEEPSIRVRKTENGVFVERTEKLRSDPAFYREQSIFERSPVDPAGSPLSPGRAGSVGAKSGEASASGANAKNTTTAANGEPVPEGTASNNDGKRTGGNQAGGWY